MEMEKEKNRAKTLKNLRKINLKLAAIIFIIGIVMFLITNPIPNEFLFRYVG